MRRPKRKIAVLGALSDLNPAYSVAQVALDHLFMLREAGEDAVFITTEEFKARDLLPEGVEVRTFPRMHGFKEDSIDVDQFDQYVFEAAACLRSALSDISCCITHDLLFLKCFLWAGWAVREAAKDLPKVRFFHWVHSGPSKRPDVIKYPLTGCYMPMPNSIYCYPNRTDTPRVAEMFECPESHIQCVYNTVDPFRLMDVHPVVRSMAKEWGLTAADTLCLYPTRMSSPKQPDKIIKLLGAMRYLGQDARLVVCNSWSNNEEQRAYILGLKEIAREWGMGESVYFTSEFPWPLEEFDIQLGLPKRAVMDLYHLVDLFVMPSVSETASLVMLEAALCKNLLVVNEDLMCMREFAGQKMDQFGSRRAVYAEFGSVTRPVTGYQPDEWSWFQQQARRLLEVQEADKAIQFFKHVRKYHSPAWVYEHQLKPLLDGI